MVAIVTVCSRNLRALLWGFPGTVHHCCSADPRVRRCPTPLQWRSAHRRRSWGSSRYSPPPSTARTPEAREPCHRPARGPWSAWPAPAWSTWRETRGGWSCASFGSRPTRAAPPRAEAAWRRSCASSRAVWCAGNRAWYQWGRLRRKTPRWWRTNTRCCRFHRARRFGWSAATNARRRCAPTPLQWTKRLSVKLQREREKVKT